MAFQYKQIKTWWNQNKLNQTIPQIPETLHHSTIPRTKSKSKCPSKPIKLLSNPSKFIAILKTEIQNYQQLLSNYNHLTRNHNNIRKLMHHYQSFLTALMKLKDSHKIEQYLK
eukprot:134603_1